jgi:hypothetical protein
LTQLENCKEEYEQRKVSWKSCGGNGRVEGNRRWHCETVPGGGRRSGCQLRFLKSGSGKVVDEITKRGGRAIAEGDFRKMLKSQTPLRRVDQTDDIAPAAVLFASDDSKWIFGETLLIAGGLR